MERFAEVAVDVATGYDRTFSYSIPRSLQVRPGHLVRVPFGPRRVQGIVFAIAQVPQVPETREIIDVVALDPILSETQLHLASWVSQYYRCALFEAAALMLPPGRRVRSKAYLSLHTEFGLLQESSLTPIERRVVEYVRSDGSSALEQDRLIEGLGRQSRSVLGRLIEKEVIVRSFKESLPTIGFKYQYHIKLVPKDHVVLCDLVSRVTRRAPRQAALLNRLVRDGGIIGLADARKEYGASAVNALLTKGWVQKGSAPVERNPLANLAVPKSPPVTFTQRQEEIVSAINTALEEPSSSTPTFLVQGVTGSGKTEIYLDAVRLCMELGKRAIVLVPEISLTHQIVARFAARFPGQVTALHSGLSAGQRFDQWWKIKQGKYGVVIGSRSAVFAPQPELGLVVMDEEHEWTYKQHDTHPRYHTRDVAFRLGELTGATVVLGSASPDVATYYKGLKKEIRLLILPERVKVSNLGKLEGDTSLASVEVVDMRRELTQGTRGIFSRSLVSAMKECLDAGEQMILFLNRRGSSSYAQCRRCGFSLGCGRCDVSLTYHRGLERLICHYCGYRRMKPTDCPECLTSRMSYYGMGTEAIVEEVSLQFPDTKILRWDRDTTRTSKAHEELLARFSSKEAQILVGTQMIAKGLHFPSVSLVGVVSADVGLNIPDYRAGEKVFQLLCQVAGRAGRGSTKGKVLVQTYQPDNYAVKAAVSQDYQAFYRREMAFRSEQANPPFTKLIHLLYAHVSQALCEKEVSRFASLIRRKRDDWGFSDIEVLGPTPAYPARLRGRYRWQLLLRGPKPRELLDRVTVPQQWVVDIDPVVLT